MITLRYSDINAGEVYYADLDPVRQYEFGQNHLCIVLEKIDDGRSVIVISLTSNSSGIGKNKINIGILKGLPQRLITDKQGRPRNTYVVLDQVRTIVTNRIQPIYDGKNLDGTKKEIRYSINDNVFSEIVCQLANLRLNNLHTKNEIMEYHKKKLFDYALDALLELIFSVIKKQRESVEVQSEVEHYYSVLKAIDNDFSITEHVKETQKELVKSKIEEILN